MSEEDEPKKAAADAADGEDDDKENLDDSRANSSLANSTFVTSGRFVVNEFGGESAEELKIKFLNSEKWFKKLFF